MCKGNLRLLLNGRNVKRKCGEQPLMGPGPGVTLNPWHKSKYDYISFVVYYFKEEF